MNLFRTGLSLYPRQKGAAGLLVAFGTVIKVKKGHFGWVAAADSGLSMCAG